MLPWAAALFAAAIALGIGLAFSETCVDGLDLREGGRIESSSYVIYETCTDTHARRVAENSVFYWYPLLLAIVGGIGGWYTTALLTRRADLWTATIGVTVALVLFVAGSALYFI